VRPAIAEVHRVIGAGGDPTDALADLDRVTGGPWQRHLALLRALGGTHLDALTT
jgi:hypothetical protein